MRRLPATALVLAAARAATLEGEATYESFFFYECAGARGNLSETFYTKALQSHPKRVASASDADLVVSHVDCFVPVGFEDAMDYAAEYAKARAFGTPNPDWRPLRRPAAPAPPADVVDVFSRKNAFLFDGHGDASDLKHWGHERTHQVMTDCAPPRHRAGYDVCMPPPFDAGACAATRDRGVARGPKAHRMTFQGLNGTRLRDRILEVHDPGRGLVVRYTDGTASCERRWRPCVTRPTKACDKCLPVEEPTDCDLLNSTYVVAATDGAVPLAPRWLEALAAGAIPIPHFHLHDAKIPLPFDGVIDWEPCVTIAPDVGGLWRHAHHEPPEETSLRQRACWRIYDDHFATPRAVGDTILAAIAKVVDAPIPKPVFRPRIRFRPPGGGRPGTLGRGG